MIVEWGPTEHLLASLVDAVNAGNWQRSGNSKAPRPRPIQRPGIEPPDDGTKRLGSGSWPIAEMRRKLDEWHQKVG